MLPDIKTILYATDLGHGASAVFRIAVSIAKKYDAKIVMLHAVEPLGTFGKTLLETYLPPDSSSKLEQETLAKVTETINRRLAKFCEDELGKGSSECDFVEDIVVVNAHPATAIKEESEKREVDMIVMGTHSQSPIGEVFMGSIARRVTQIAKMPVLVVPINN